MVACEVCGEQFDVITYKHLAKHELSVSQYKIQFPTALMKSEAALARKKESANRANALRKGVARSDKVKAKIAATKAANPTVAWNKGVSPTEEVKARMSETRKRKFASGELVHWNVGNVTPEHTREKIRTTLASAERVRSIEAKQKTRDTVQLKKDSGWVKTTSYRPTAEHKQLFRDYAVARNVPRIQQAIDRATIIATANGLSIAADPDYNSYLFWLTCHTCHTVYTRTRNAFIVSKLTQSAYRCPTCFPRQTGVSVAETELFNFVKQLLPTVTIIPNDRTVLHGRELDILIPALNIAFEFNGLYWHSEAAGGKDSKYHLWKSQLAWKNGIRLISIFEDEWTAKQEIVKSRIRHILGKSGSSIVVGARKCTLSAITALDKNTFLTDYHIQGSDVSGIRYGAYYKETLVGVMTFTSTSMVKGGNGSLYELNRFAVKPGYHIPGVASKLFARFVKDHNPAEVISYADRRWSVGNLYSQIGFSLVGVTPASYWYMEPGYQSRKHRSQFMKHMLPAKLGIFDANLTEWQNMQAAGYDRIWDCGNLKFEWRASYDK